MWIETCIDYQTIYDKRKYVNQSRWKTSIAAFQPLSIIPGSSIMFYVHCIQIDVCKSANFKCTLCIRYLFCLNTELSGKITPMTINVIGFFPLVHWFAFWNINQFVKLEHQCLKLNEWLVLWISVYVKQFVHGDFKLKSINLPESVIFQALKGFVKSGFTWKFSNSFYAGIYQEKCY